MSADLDSVRLAWQTFATAAQPALDHWYAALEKPAMTQARNLARILAANQECAFGQAFGFSRIKDIAQFRTCVPIHTYTDLSPWVERAQHDTSPVLTAQRPRFFERTSGNSALQKLIPYTPAFLEEMQGALTVWLADLYQQAPEIAEGRAYWSMSPPLQMGGVAPNGIPIGSTSDLDYLGGSIIAGLAPTLIIPPQVSDVSAWRKQTLLALLAADDLSFISVWSPTFLTSLLRPLFEADDPERAETFAWLESALPTKRQFALRQAISSGTCSALWPRLAAISCWMDGPSQNFARQLGKLFPQVRCLPKGLFATEGVVSLPFGEGAGCPLAIGSHFLEFVFDDGSVGNASDLHVGDTAQILLTTGGGLYRYALGDRVRVVGMTGCTPRIQFVGRAGVTCDLVGEKLDEETVARVLALALKAGDSACLVPCANAEPPHYLLLVSAEASLETERLLALVEEGLTNAFHYAQARQLNQLGPLRGRRLASPAHLANLQQQAAEASGIRAGDVKPRVLINRLATASAIVSLLDA